MTQDTFDELCERVRNTIGLKDPIAIAALEEIRNRYIALEDQEHQGANCTIDMLLGKDLQQEIGVEQREHPRNIQLMVSRLCSVINDQQERIAKMLDAVFGYGTVYEDDMPSFDDVEYDSAYLFSKVDTVRIYPRLIVDAIQGKDRATKDMETEELMKDMLVFQEPPTATEWEIMRRQMQTLLLPTKDGQI